MTWLDALTTKHKVVPSIFQRVDGQGAQNDNMMLLLERVVGEYASINDLFPRQRLSREAITAILIERVRRRLR